MTIITTALCLLYRIWSIQRWRLVDALRAHVETISWRRRILRSLDQRRRG